MSILRKNCCDGIYNSFDVHFTSNCDNKCAHCIDLKYEGLGINKPNPVAIANSIIDNVDGYDDVLFLGGEPCLYLKELYECIEIVKFYTDLKIYITTAIPITCYNEYNRFIDILKIVDGVNLSVQHHDEKIADQIRKTVSKYDRQKFYNNLPYKHKIRINLNIVKPFLYKREDIIKCLLHYDKMGFNEIKLSEIQHGKDYFVSFEKTFDIKLKSPFSYGCQTYIDTSKIIPDLKTPLLLKRSCFLCEETLKASILDGIKVSSRLFTINKGKYAVIYENGYISNQWV